MPIRKPNRPERTPITEGFIVSEWITTNGFDVEFFLNDAAASRIEILESDDGSTWEMTNHVTGEITTHASRLAAMTDARAFIKANGLRAIPSPEQRAAKWFRGDDADYTTDRRDSSIGMTLIAPGSVAARQAVEKAASVAPVIVPVPPAFDANQAARDLNAMMLADKLNRMLRGET